MPYDFSEERELTNDQLSGELAKLTPLTVGEINNILPKKIEKQRLSQLIKIVNNSTSQNKKLASLNSSFSDLGGVILKLLMKYLKPI